MARLREDLKRFVVMRLACFRTPTEVAREVEDLFAVQVDRTHVAYYDAARPASRCPKKWQPLFWETREAYRAAETDSAIALDRWRLEELEDLYRRAKTAGRQGNIPLALQILEQAAKERGGAYTNRHRLEHSGQIQTTGVLLVPAEAGIKDWGAAAREAQAKLDADATAAA